MASRRPLSEQPEPHRRLYPVEGQFAFPRGVPSPGFSTAEGQFASPRGVPSPSPSAAEGQFAFPLAADASSASRAPAAELERPRGSRWRRPSSPRVPSGESLFACVSALVAGAANFLNALGPAPAPWPNKPAAAPTRGGGPAHFAAGIPR